MSRLTCALFVSPLLFIQVGCFTERVWNMERTKYTRMFDCSVRRMGHTFAMAMQTGSRHCIERSTCRAERGTFVQY